MNEEHYHETRKKQTAAKLRNKRTHLYTTNIPGSRIELLVCLEVTLARDLLNKGC